MAKPDKFQDKYRISTARWAAWDYASNAAYFVTICTVQRSHDFGQIMNGNMVFSVLGQAALDSWNAIPAHFPFVELGESVVMPNHVHGILIINKPPPVETQNLASPSQSPPRDTASPSLSPSRDLASLSKNKFGPQSKNLASIIRGYKIGVTEFARHNKIPYQWQARYYDHVIRNLEEHERIREYILTNIQNWKKDKFYGDTSS